MMIFPVEGLESGLGYDNYPNIQKWVDLVKARPAYQRAEAKGGPTNLKAFIS
jgi:glutathione S-transferase